MRIGVLTFHRPLNYGAVLQCHCLVEALRGLGGEPCVIDYRPAYLESTRRRTWKRFGLHPLNRIRGRLRPRFDAFLSERLPLSGRACRSTAELEAHGPDLDALVLGSDQIWNPALTGGALDPAFFGEFAAPDVKRIAYAASFGGADGIDIRELARRLAGLHALSVRETGGAGLVRDATGRPSVAIVADPVFLVEARHFETLREPARDVPERFVLVHAMQPGPELLAAARTVAGKLGVEALMPITNTARPRFLGPDLRGTVAGPGEWLDLLARAEHVVTNSFHAVALSLILGTPFSFVPLTGALAKRNDRVEALLARTGAGESALTAMRAEGLAYLRDNL